MHLHVHVRVRVFAANDRNENENHLPAYPGFTSNLGVRSVRVIRVSVSSQLSVVG